MIFPIAATVAFAAEARLRRELFARRALAAVALPLVSLRRKKTLSRGALPLGKEPLTGRPIPLSADPAVGGRRLAGLVARLDPDGVGAADVKFAWSVIIGRSMHCRKSETSAVKLVTFVPVIRHVSVFKSDERNELNT